MSFSGRVVSKVKRTVTEQVAGSWMGGFMAQKISGNYILMYHGVSAEGGTRFNRRHASVVCFEKQLRFLKKHCSVISLDDFFERRFDTQKPNFALTFDDGYLNNFTYAKPLLEAYQCPASFFITGLNEVKDQILWADYVNIASVLTDSDIEIENEPFKKKGDVYFSELSGNSLYEVVKTQKADYSFKQKVKEAFGKYVNFENDPSIREYWQLMNDRQIQETAKSKYIKIGSHGYFHNNLGAIPEGDALEELKRSKNYLESLVQYEMRQLAYPDGSYTPSLVKTAGQMGFNIQLAADHFLFNEPADNPDIKKRYGIYTIDSCLNQLFTAINLSV